MPSSYRFRYFNIMTSTYFPSPKEQQEKKWFLVDANGKILGRLAARIARVLRGKEKAAYSPNVDMGDYVVVINAKDIKVTGKKLEQEFFATHSKYPSGLKVKSAKQVLEQHPERLLYAAISGMMPKTILGTKMLKKLRVYPGAEHPHAAQPLMPLELS